MATKTSPPQDTPTRSLESEDTDLEQLERTSLESSVLELLHSHHARMSQLRGDQMGRRNRTFQQQAARRKAERTQEIAVMYAGLEQKRKSRLHGRIVEAKAQGKQAARQFMAAWDARTTKRLQAQEAEQRLERELLVLNGQVSKDNLKRTLKMGVMALGIAAAVAMGLIQTKATSYTNELVALEEFVMESASAHSVLVDDLVTRIAQSYDLVEQEKAQLEVEIATAQSALESTFEELTGDNQLPLEFAKKNPSKPRASPKVDRVETRTSPTSDSLLTPSDPFLSGDCSPGDPLCATL